MPVTADELGKIYDSAGLENPDSVTLWCAISVAWFFMLRMWGVPGEGPENGRRRRSEFATSVTYGENRTVGKWLESRMARRGGRNIHIHIGV